LRRWKKLQKFCTLCKFVSGHWEFLSCVAVNKPNKYCFNILTIYTQTLVYGGSEVKKTITGARRELIVICLLVEIAGR